MTWEQQQEIIVKVERRYLPVLESRIKAIYRYGLGLYKEGKLSELDNKFFDEELLKIITAIYINAGVPMARYVYKTMPKKRELKAGQMGISQTWLNAVKNYLGRYALQFVTDIIGTLRDDMISLFQKAAAEGWSYEKIAYELLRNGLALKRARRIARTEAHRGAMKGSIEGARALPYEVQKEWLSATDKRVRREPKDKFDHALLNGQVKELDEPFTNEEKIMFPGDPEASEGNTIQCRCVLNYIPKRNPDGSLMIK